MYGWALKVTIFFLSNITNWPLAACLVQALHLSKALLYLKFKRPSLSVIHNQLPGDSLCVWGLSSDDASSVAIVIVKVNNYHVSRILVTMETSHWLWSVAMATYF